MISPRAIFAALPAAGVTLMLAAPEGAFAQEIEPNEFVPPPAGTNLLLAYYDYGHDTSYNVANGSTFSSRTGLEVNVGVLRLIHITSLFGHPAGVQIYQGFGSLSGAQIGGQSLGSSFGAQDTVLSAFFWPYSNQATGTNVIVSTFLYPPDGGYDRTSGINIGDNRLKGDVQLGYDQQVGAHFSMTIGGDVLIDGENNDYTIYGLKLETTPTYRIQGWANWRWTPAFQTSFGYEGLFGGIESVEGTRDGNRTEEQRLRAAASLFVSRRAQILIEVNHDIQVTGGFSQEFGVIGRFAYVF